LLFREGRALRNQQKRAFAQEVAPASQQKPFNPGNISVVTKNLSGLSADQKFPLTINSDGGNGNGVRQARKSAVEPQAVHRIESPSKLPLNGRTFNDVGRTLSVNKRPIARQNTTGAAALKRRSKLTQYENYPMSREEVFTSKFNGEALKDGMMFH